MQGFIEFLTTMPFWYWWAFAVILLVIELATGSTYFLWPSASALVVGLFAISPLGSYWQLQLLMFASVAILLSLWQPRRVKEWIHSARADRPNLNESGAQKVGARVTVEKTFVNGSGKVRLGDTLWLADAETGEDYAEGDQLVVTSVRGVKLIVGAG